MAETYVLSNKTEFVEVADAIRNKGGTSAKLSFPDGFISAIASLEASGSSSTPNLQSKTVSPSTSTKTITPDTGYDGLSDVTINAIQTETKTTSASTTKKVTVKPTSGKYLTEVSINQINNQSKTVTPSESSQTVTPDSAYDGLSSVSVNAISSSYVGTGISKQSAQTIVPTSQSQIAVAAGVYTTGATTVAAVPAESKIITANGTYTPTSGNYYSSVTVSVPNDEVTYDTPSISVDSSSGLITAIANGKSATQQLSTQGTTTITPSSTAQTAVSAGKYTTGAVTVSAVPTETLSATSNGTYTPTSGKYYSSATVAVPFDTPSISVSSAGLITASANGKSATKQLTTQGATTITPSSTSQTAVSSGKYTTGAVTVSAVPTETKSVTPSTSSQTVTPTSGKFLSSVSVGAISTETKSITSNGTYTPTSGKYFSEVTVNVPNDEVTYDTPSISVSSGGLITASANGLSATKQLTTKGSTLITPTTSTQTAVSAGVYTTGAITVAGDSNLLASNIKSGTSIFGVTGTYSGDSSGGSSSTTTEYIVDLIMLCADSTTSVDLTIGSNGHIICPVTAGNIGSLMALTSAALTSASAVNGYCLQLNPLFVKIISFLDNSNINLSTLSKASIVLNWFWRTSTSTTNYQLPKSTIFHEIEPSAGTAKTYYSGTVGALFGSALVEYSTINSSGNIMSYPATASVALSYDPSTFSLSNSAASALFSGVLIPMMPNAVLLGQGSNASTLTSTFSFGHVKNWITIAGTCSTSAFNAPIGQIKMTFTY